MYFPLASLLWTLCPSPNTISASLSYLICLLKCQVEDIIAQDIFIISSQHTEALNSHVEQNQSQLWHPLPHPKKKKGKPNGSHIVQKSWNIWKSVLHLLLDCVLSRWKPEWQSTEKILLWEPLKEFLKMTKSERRIPH